MARTKTKRLPEGPFYRDLGRNLRVARSASGKTQTEIAEYLDLTFQQVQKYENGTNRIPLDRLVSLANYLEVPLSQFVTPSDGDSTFQSLAAQFGAKEFHALMEAWGSIKDRTARAALLNLVRRMADLKC
jgi:transcriptional regulator with XRE-family HTH domain